MAGMEQRRELIAEYIETLDVYVASSAAALLVMRETAVSGERATQIMVGA